MTLEEAMARIKELERENAALKKMPMPRRDARPNFRTILPSEEYGGITRSDADCLSRAIRRQIFGTTEVQICDRGRWVISNQVKRPYEMSEEEYAKFTEVFGKILYIIKESADGWKEAKHEQK